MCYYLSWADPASKVLERRFQLYLVVKSPNIFTTLREMKYISQHCCDKTLDQGSETFFADRFQPGNILRAGAQDNNECLAHANSLQLVSPHCTDSELMATKMAASKSVTVY